MNTSSNDFALTLNNISISFSGVKVLDRASFSLKKNEIHAIVGKNGAGKSTFMKILTGVYTPNSGEITIGNQSYTIQSNTKSRYQQVAMVYQDLSLIPSLSILQNIFLVHHPYKKFGILQDSKAITLAEKLLSKVGLSYLSVHTLVETLSAGEAQLVEIAKAISSNPEIIVFDEPTASLSDIETKALFETILSLKAQGLSIIYITHYLEDVMKLCDSVTILRNGEVISTKEIRKTSISEIVSDMLGAEIQNKTVWQEQGIEKSKTAYLEIKNALTSKVGPITLSAYRGEIIGIAGLLGSGRTEILRMLYGLDPIISGTISIEGKPILLHSPRHAKSSGIALVPEERRTQGLILDFDIEENIALPILHSICTHSLIDNDKKSEIANKMITQLQVKTTGRKQVVRFLSGGNQQKVVIAKCLASNPTILLLDDPTYGVDIHAKLEIMKIIKNFVNKGNIVLFVSSEFSEIADFCDRTYIVKKKTISNQFDNNTLSEEELLKQVQ